MTPDEAAVERALEKAAEAFERYVILHRLKNPPDNAKADANERLAAMCRAALEIAAAPAPGDAWRPIETLPDGDEPKLFYSPAGMFIASGIGPKPARTEAVKLATQGHWPNAQFSPTHWRHLPAPPASRRAQGAGA